jgi:hypothetical protein
MADRTPMHKKLKYRSALEIALQVVTRRNFSDWELFDISLCMDHVCLMRHLLDVHGIMVTTEDAADLHYIASRVH